MSKLNSYNAISSYYDVLKHLFFLGQLERAERWLLKYVDKDDHLIIVGGGSGKCLKGLANKRLAQLTFVEASSKMIIKAKRNTNNMKVDFVHETHENIDYAPFNKVWLPFFLDLFSDEENIFFVKRLKRQGVKQLLIVDFQDQGKWWQRVILKSMFQFFGYTTRLKTKKLFDLSFMANTLKLKEVDRQLFLNGFVVAVVYDMST